jgi:hypothetical protein
MRFETTLAALDLICEFVFIFTPCNSKPKSMFSVIAVSGEQRLLYN